MSGITVMFNDGLKVLEGQYAFPIEGVYDQNDSIVVTSKGDNRDDYDHVVTLPDNVSALEIDEAMEQDNVEEIGRLFKGTKAFVDEQSRVNVAELPTNHYG